MPAPADMNWAVVVYFPFQVVAMIYWWFWGYKSFTGPRANIPNKASKDGVDASDEDEKRK